jgi:hypothetical protein
LNFDEKGCAICPESGQKYLLKEGKCDKLMVSQEETNA